MGKNTLHKLAITKKKNTSSPGQCFWHCTGNCFLNSGSALGKWKQFCSHARIPSRGLTRLYSVAGWIAWRGNLLTSPTCHELSKWFWTCGRDRQSQLVDSNSIGHGQSVDPLVRSLASEQFPEQDAITGGEHKNLFSRQLFSSQFCGEMQSLQWLLHFPKKEQIDVKTTKTVLSQL